MRLVVDVASDVCHQHLHANAKQLQGIHIEQETVYSLSVPTPMVRLKGPTMVEHLRPLDRYLKIDSSVVGIRAQ